MTQKNIIETTQACPCCSELTFGECCGPVISGSKIAASPLELMRSRFTAHITRDIDHIMASMRGKPLKLFDRESTEKEWFEQCTWKKLEILEVSEIGKHTKDGIVEFKAYYDFAGAEHILHERSKFQKFDDQWFYISGQKKNAHIQTSDKVGRNDPCTCGSGKKYKKCCANVAASNT